MEIKNPGHEARVSAEREGFEPPVPCGTAVFKTAAIDHSAISPMGCKCKELNRAFHQANAKRYY
jgi:hypothetical protein